MAFRFPLQAVLNLRRSQERWERRRLALLNRQFAEVGQLLEALDLERITARGRLARELSQGLSGAEIRFQADWESLRTQYRSQLTHRRAELEQQCRAQREVLERARQPREILEELRSRQQKLYLQEQARREQQQNDEMFLFRGAAQRDG